MIIYFEKHMFRIIYLFQIEIETIGEIGNILEL